VALSAENYWQHLGEKCWHTLGENTWYIIGRKMTLGNIPDFMPILPEPIDDLAVSPIVGE
jgi:hypothetical protein